MITNQSMPAVNSPRDITFESSSNKKKRKTEDKKNVIPLPEKLPENSVLSNEDKKDIEGKNVEKNIPGTIRKKNNDSINYTDEKREQLEFSEPHDKENVQSQSKLNPETELFTPRDPDETKEDPLKARKYSDNMRNRNQPL